MIFGASSPRGDTPKFMFLKANPLYDITLSQNFYEKIPFFLNSEQTNLSKIRCYLAMEPKDPRPDNGASEERTRPHVHTPSGDGIGPDSKKSCEEGGEDE
jgi:hypothetical protein